MMAHELPLTIPVPQYDGPPKPKPNGKKRTNKEKISTVRTLPTGEPVDFGNNKKSSKKSSNTKSTSPTLPDGSAPNFYNGQSSISNTNSAPTGSRKKKQQQDSQSHPNGSNNNESKKSEQSLPNGSKPNFNPGAEKPSKKTGKQTSSKGDKKNPANAVAMEENYAGSSFHSSPAALNLPKPSFKTSPKSRVAQQTVITSPQQQLASPQQQQTFTSPLQMSAPLQQFPHPMQQHPAAGPMYPVAPYGQGKLPPAFPSPNQNPMIYRGNQFVQPGFSYQHSPQGYITYQNGIQGHPNNTSVGVPMHHAGPPPQHMSHPPPPPPPGAYMPYVQQPVQQYHVPAAQSGQKISFNDLLGSTSK
ncbi:enhancer of mRNA-decapping protein 1 [[Candida] anglica]